MWTAIALFAIILALLFYFDTKKPKNFPPGPSWLPIIGSVLTINRLRRKTGYLYKATADLAKEYGNVVGLRVGKDKIAMAYSFEAIREMLTKDEFQGRPTGPFYETRTWGLRRGILLVDQEFWIEQRRWALRQLREFGYGKRNMASLVEDECIYLVKDVKASIQQSNTDGAVLKVDEFFGVYVLNTLWSMMASIRYSPEDEEVKELQAMLADLFLNIDMVGALFSQFPILQYLAPEYSGYNFFMNIHRRIWKFLRTELQNHKATYKPGVVRDFMDAYLEVIQSEDKSPTFTEAQLVAICMDFFMAGSETTSKSLSFGFLNLLLNPEVQKKAQAEIDRVVGQDRMPQLSDRPNMPYVESLVLESIRMFMLRAFSIPHRALKNTTLQGYNIPKGTMVLANFYGVLTDYEDAENFRPDRFLKEGRVQIPDTYMPFGFGKHRCLGETLARANIFLYMSSLLQKFDFSIEPGTKPPTNEGVDACTPATGPFSAYVTYRPTIHT